MHMELTQQAQTALINVGTNRQGATIPTTTPIEAQGELWVAGLIGRGNPGGLTRKGTIVRQRLVDTRLEEAFGA